jgi:Integrase core domain
MRSAGTSPPTPRRSTLVGAGTLPTSRPGKAGSTSPRSSISPRAASSGSPWLITLRTELVADALANAAAARDPAPGVIFHSDRGCQPGCTSAAFADLAGDCQVSLSVGRKGQCWDNAVAKSFFASLKGELTDTRAWPTRAAACRAVVEYIAWYNGTRLHSTLGYRSPADIENGHHGKISKVA